MTENTNLLTKATGAEWIKFLKFLSIGAGAGFLLSGVIFFFAYNWSEMHRFTKMGIVGALMLACYGGVFLTKKNLIVQNVLITAMSVIVGVMLALYGQVYQLEADSYQMFLTWGLAILVWAIAADFYPLWLIEIGLFCMSIALYKNQGPSWRHFDENCYLVLSPTFLFSVTAVFTFLHKMIPGREPAPRWFMNVIFTTSHIYLTIASMFENNGFPMLVFLMATALLYYYSINQKNLWTYSLIFIGGLMLFLRYSINIGNMEAVTVLLFDTIVLVVGVYFLSKHLIDKNNEWNKDGNK